MKFIQSEDLHIVDTVVPTMICKINIIILFANSKCILQMLFMQSTIFLAVGPLDVKILGANMPLSAGKVHDLLCQSSGSRPPASITWWKGEQRLEKTKETVSPLSVWSTRSKHFCVVMKESLF